MPDNPTSRPTLGGYLDEKRQRAGCSLRDLAKITGSSVSMIHRLLKDGIDRPSPATLALLAEILNLSLAKLFRLAGYPYPDIDDILRTDHGLSAEEAAEIKTQALMVAPPTREGMH